MESKVNGTAKAMTKTITAATDDNELLLNDTKTIVNSLIIPNPNGVSLRTLCSDYEEIEGKDIPYTELGYHSLTAFLKSMPDMIRMVSDGGGGQSDSHSWTLYPVCNESVEHMMDLVANQSKKTRKRKVNARSGFGVGARRLPTIGGRVVKRRPIGATITIAKRLTRNSGRLLSRNIQTKSALVPLRTNQNNNRSTSSQTVNQSSGTGYTGYRRTPASKPEINKIPDISAFIRREKTNSVSNLNLTSTPPVPQSPLFNGQQLNKQQFSPVVKSPSVLTNGKLHNRSLTLGQWSQQLSSGAGSGPPVAAEPALATLSDWLQRKSKDLKPENRIQTFCTQAEQALDEEDYEQAIVHYSKAIELSPNDYALLGKRAYCLEKVEKYDLCLLDAQRAIDISEHMLRRQISKSNNCEDSAKYWPNKLIYYRKGRALRALKQFQESIDAFVLAKNMVIRCPFVDEEIRAIKLEIICDLGYDRMDVQSVCDSLDSIEGLIKLLNHNKQLMITNSNAIPFIGDEEHKVVDNTDQLPTNPFRYRGLYVNGLVSTLDEQQLEQLLESCGEIIRCKVYSNREQSRAILTFSEEQSVREAIRTIRQHKEVIRDGAVDQLVIRYRHTCVEGGTDPQQDFKGTEIGGECYKWRTIGCEDSDCKALHIPICHHLDQQSVETESIVKRKRQPIVFDTESTTANSSGDRSGDKKVKTSPNKVLITSTTEDMNQSGDDMNDDSISTLSPIKSVDTIDGLLTPHLNGTTDSANDLNSTPICDPRLRPRDKMQITFKNTDSVENGLNDNQSPIRQVGVTNKQVIKLKPSSNSTPVAASPATADTESAAKKVRKYIVFDLKPDSDTNNLNSTPKLVTNGRKSRKSGPDLDTPIKPLAPPLMSTNPNDRSVTSYDDLF